ncbi:hypothetical protein DFR86_02715 [Acidianus sulfidivorans JP7]|uniref:Uncharacterized protein n=1 Tax=Acidianus sulfidivorans JP7 TaxID=619593 RepID=A0A2U9IKP8_9CREN|nr:hypothetical protein [Acidianus sulfidivorans]AWR96566.1 hypothetical protein DFR86_02715 [Acidianus sulfidivorans JP7]
MSPVIAMIFVLIIMVAIIVPEMYLITSTPAKYEQAYVSAEPKINLANEQLQEVNTPLSPIGFYYNNQTGQAYIVYYGEPEVPLNISYFIGYNEKDNNITIIKVNDPSLSNFQNYPEQVYNVGYYSELALVTTLGNIIYADPYYTISNMVNSSNAQNIIPVQIIPIQSFNCRINPTDVVTESESDLVSHYLATIGGYSDVEINTLKENNEWINLTLLSDRSATSSGSGTIGFLSRANLGNGFQYNFYGLIDYDSWSHSILFNISSYIPNTYFENLYNYYYNYKDWLGQYVSIEESIQFPLNVDFHIIGNQIYVYFIHDGTVYKLPYLNPVNDSGLAGIYSGLPSYWPPYEANYTSPWTLPTPHISDVSNPYLAVYAPYNLENYFPFGWIQATGGDYVFAAGYNINGICTTYYLPWKIIPLSPFVPYDPIPNGAPIEIFIGGGLLLANVTVGIG